jgi:hypothetical protein
MFHLFFLGFLYFLPTILATRRGHGIFPILLLNFFFGWTGIGWIVMFFWAICSHPRYCYYPHFYTSPAPPPRPDYTPNHPYWRRY